MYYLFIRNIKSLEAYRKEFDRVSEAMELGKTPVYSEIRANKTALIESIPFNSLMGVFMIIGAIILNLFDVNSTIAIAVSLVINNLCSNIANYIFTRLKHVLRLKLCDRLGVERSEKSIAVMESLEYQSV